MAPPASGVQGPLPPFPSPSTVQPSSLSRLTLSDKLLLSQAVHHIGSSPPDWGRVSSILLSHPLIKTKQRLEQAAKAGITLGRVFGSRECERAWVALMRQYNLVLQPGEKDLSIEHDTDPSSTAGMGNRSKEARGLPPKMDRGSQLALAQYLYAERIREIQDTIKAKEESFKVIVAEIEKLNAGALDEKLLEDLEKSGKLREEAAIAAKESAEADALGLRSGVGGGDESSSADATPRQEEASRGVSVSSTAGSTPVKTKEGETSGKPSELPATPTKSTPVKDEASQTSSLAPSSAERDAVGKDEPEAIKASIPSTGPAEKVAQEGLEVEHLKQTEKIATTPNKADDVTMDVNDDLEEDKSSDKDKTNEGEVDEQDEEDEEDEEDEKDEDDEEDTKEPETQSEAVEKEAEETNVEDATGKRKRDDAEIVDATEEAGEDESAVKRVKMDDEGDDHLDKNVEAESSVEEDTPVAESTTPQQHTERTEEMALDEEEEDKEEKEDIVEDERMVDGGEEEAVDELDGFETSKRPEPRRSRRSGRNLTGTSDEVQTPGPSSSAKNSRVEALRSREPSGTSLEADEERERGTVEPAAEGTPASRSRTSMSPVAIRRPRGASRPSRRSIRASSAGGRAETDEGQAGGGSDAERERAAEKVIKGRKMEKVLMMLLNEVSNHTHGNLFHAPIKESDAPDYYQLIRHPLDLKTIKSRIKEGRIATSTQLRRALMQMFANSLIYNRPGSDIHRMALEMRDAAEEMLDRFEQTQLSANISRR